MTVIKRKVVAYITHENRLLVFSHPDFPEAGIQVPAGTIEEGERPEKAAMREAEEETGLQDLEMVRTLGEATFDRAVFGEDELHHRHFFHLRCTSTPRETWRHFELHCSDGSPEPIAFDFFWVQLPGEVPELVAGQGALLPRLMEMLGMAH